MGVDVRALSQQLQSEWKSGTDATFSPADKVTGWKEFPVYENPRTFDFEECETISIWNGTSRAETDSLFMLQGAAATGTITVPGGLQVMVKEGKAKVRGN